MADANWQEFNNDLISAMGENIDWLDKAAWATFAAVANFSISLALISEQGDDFQDSDYATIIRNAPDENGIFVGQKGKSLLAMFYGDSGSVIIQYNTEDKSGSYQIFDEDVESYAHESQALAEAFMNNRDQGDVPAPNTGSGVGSADDDDYIRRRVAWGEGYINDNGEFVEF